MPRTARANGQGAPAGEQIGRPGRGLIAPGPGSADRVEPLFPALMRDAPPRRSAGLMTLNDVLIALFEAALAAERREIAPAHRPANAAPRQSLIVRPARFRCTCEGECLWRWSPFLFF